MASTFLHGVSITEVLVGGVPITVVPAAVIGLVGTAPTWAVPSTSLFQPPKPNVPTLIGSTGQAGAFGPMIQGYTIPYALNHIQLQATSGVSSIGQTIAINVFNPAVHNTAVVSQALTMPASGTQYVNTGHMGLVGPGLNGYAGGTTVVLKNGAGSTTYLEGTDFTVDYINGIIFTKSGGAITVGEALTASYSYCDPSKVADADLIGAVTMGVYTGMQAFLTCTSLMGFTPHILIVPAYAAGGTGVGSKDATVATAMIALASTIKAFALLDSTPATTVATALSNRSNVATPFGTASYRAVLCYPCLDFTDLGFVPTGTTINTAGAVINQVANTTVDGPLSAWVAGAWSSQIVNRGFWWSPSNVTLNGPIGPDVQIYMSYTDPQADTNTLNAAGIFTVLNMFGTGLRSWGDRSAAYPTYTDVSTFLPVRMVLDIVELSIQLASLQFLDQPISTGLINNVLLSINGFLRDLIRQGGLLPGSNISYNPGDNPPLSLAAGIITFAVNLMGPPPAEHIIYSFVVNTALLANIGPVQQSQALTA